SCCASKSLPTRSSREFSNSPSCHSPTPRGAASWTIPARRIWNGVFMGTETQTNYLEYMITVTEAGGRFTPRVTRDGHLIEHDGHASEVWVAASCGSLDRAMSTAKPAIDNDRIC